MEQVRRALELASSNIALAACALQCERGTLYDYMERYPELKEIRPRKRNEMINIAEGASP